MHLDGKMFQGLEHVETSTEVIANLWTVTNGKKKKITQN